MAGAMKVIDLETLGEGGVEIDGVRDGVVNGGIITGVGDVNGDGLADFSVTSGFWNGANPNQDMVFFGGDALSPVLGEAECDGVHGFTVTPRMYDQGKANPLKAAGDLNGDGVDDFGLGSWSIFYHPGMVLYGDADRTDAHLELPTETGSEGVLLPLSNWVAAGDVNGDGFDDILSQAEIDYYGTARVVLTFGGPTGSDSQIEFTRSSGEYFGSFIDAVGDINGDGFADIGIQGQMPDHTQAEYIIFGHADFGAVDLTNMTPEEGFLQRGPVTAAGDINGDGFGDYIMRDAVIFGHAGPFTNIEHDAVDGSDGFRLKLGDTYRSVAAVGDFNGDGFDDVACSDYSDSDGGDKAGAIYVIFGKAKGFHTVVKVDHLTETTGVKIIGALPNNQISSVSALGDVNGDGIDDIGISDPNHLSAATGYDTGAAYVVYGLQPETAVKHVGGDDGQRFAGGAFADKLYGMGGDDSLWGNGGDDRLDGGLGNDALHGGDGQDLIRSGAGADELNGGLDKDNLQGGDEADTLIGGGGADRLSGGTGADVFVYQAVTDSTLKAHDLITDLIAIDFIDLSAVDADTGLDGDQAFHHVANFSHQAGELTLKYDSSSGVTLLQGDVDGDGTADLAIWITGDHHLFANLVL